MPVRDCRQLRTQLEDAIGRGHVEALAPALVEIAVIAAVISNQLELVPRRRYVTDADARELALRLADLDVVLAGDPARSA